MNNDLLKILLVDDDEDDYIMTRDLLLDIEGIKIDIEWISSYDKALEAISRGGHDVKLFDYRLGEHSGLDLLKEAIARGCKIPVILLTGQGNKETDLEAMNAGASDYLVKGQLNPSILERSIRYAIERKRTERQISEERDRAQSYLDIAGVMLLAIDKDQIVTLINKKGCEILDVREDEITGKNWFDNFIPERDRDNIKAVFNSLMKGETGEIEFYENQVLRKDGEERLISWENSVVRDDAGNITGTLSSGEDITEKRLTEESIEENQARLVEDHEVLHRLFKQVEISKKEWEKTLDCTGDMIILTDKDGKIRRFNRSVLEFSGKAFDELLGIDWEDLINENDLETVTLYAGSTELLHKPSQKWFELRSYPFDDGDLDFSGTVITLHDTSEIKNITEKLEKRNTEIDENREKLQLALNEISSLIIQTSQQKGLQSGSQTPTSKNAMK